MNLDEYQDALEAFHVQRPDPLTYGMIGLFGEAGELAETFKKCLRQKPIEEIKLDPMMLVALTDELGDVLWYVAWVSRELGFNLSEIAHGNLSKLRKRHLTPHTHSSDGDR